MIQTANLLRPELETFVASVAPGDYEQAKKQIFNAALDHREYCAAIRLYAKLARL